MQRPSVSVVIPTRAEWPAIEPVVAMLGAQVVDAGAEIVVVDGTMDGSALDRRIPTPLREHLRVVAAPGSDVFELRARGLLEACGEIVAMSEDHSVPAPDYVTKVLSSHARHPERAVAGAVINGSTDRLIDRVNFLLVHARNLPPRNALPGGSWTPTPTNVSYKRAAIPSDLRDPGWLETVHNVELLHAHEVVFDDTIVMAHVQSIGFFETFRNHFRAGKSTGGLARTAIGTRAQQLRWGLGSSIGLPGHLVRPVWQLRRRWAKNHRALLNVLPLAVALSVFAATGFLFGVIAGPGRSPERMA
jgi:hypothetical protein